MNSRALVLDFYRLYHEGFSAGCSGQGDAANCRICVISVISGGVYRNLAEVHHGSSPYLIYVLFNINRNAPQTSSSGDFFPLRKPIKCLFTYWRAGGLPQCNTGVLRIKNGHCLGFSIIMHTGFPKFYDPICSWYVSTYVAPMILLIEYG
ncbi:uncharacterized protein BDW70DRAFT_131746 [Aspergillus foveolatus]|uniref:uncharacterized protein n=1 Tax=Aspergillus foveolatus TaxID=210207 RepID=UPI003CCCDB9B